MRVGAVGDHGIRMLDHGLGDVGVQVEGGDDREVRCQLADPAEQLALAVLQMLGDHGTVQVEKERIERAGTGEVVEQHADQAFVGVAGHRPGGAGIGPGQRHQLVAWGGCLDEARDGEVDPGRVGEDRLAPRERRPAVGLLEALEGGGLGGEAVGLVMQPADADPCHRLTSPRAGPSRPDGRRRRHGPRGCNNAGRQGRLPHAAGRCCAGGLPARRWRSPTPWRRRYRSGSRAGSSRPARSRRPSGRAGSGPARRA